MHHSTFKSKLLHAQSMRDRDARSHYWRGYLRGLRRAYHGKRVGTEQEHALWLSMVYLDNPVHQELGCGYRDGLNAATSTAKAD
jgi:hypothetical protein